MRLRIEIETDKRTPPAALTIECDGDERDLGGLLARAGLLIQSNGVRAAFQMLHEAAARPRERVDMSGPVCVENTRPEAVLSACVCPRCGRAGVAKVQPFISAFTEYTCCPACGLLLDGVPVAAGELMAREEDDRLLAG